MTVVLVPPAHASSVPLSVAQMNRAGVDGAMLKLLEPFQRCASDPCRHRHDESGRCRCH
jgi:hypothetical protein